MLNAGNYFNDPRCWALVSASMVGYLLEQHPGQLAVRRIAPEPISSNCNLIVSKSCSRSDVVNTLLNCCREYLAERPYLESLLPDNI